MAEMPDTKQVRSQRATILLLVFSAPVLILLLILGTWQVDRLQQKNELIARVQERLTEQQVDFSSIVATYERGGDIEYRPVKVTGSFEHRGEQHYFATWQGQSGYFVHTPLDLGDGRVVFINRGFVPFDRKSPETREAGQIGGIVNIGGLSRMPELKKPSFLIPDNDIAGNVIYWRDIPQMAQAAGYRNGEVYPFFIDADETPNPGGLPVGGVTRIDFPNNHLQYAATWYGLALALVGVIGAWFIRQRRHAVPAQD